MNKPPSKSLTRSISQLSTSNAPSEKPSLKRKPIQELSHQTVRSKLNSSAILPLGNHNKVAVQLNKTNMSSSQTFLGKENKNTTKFPSSNLNRGRKNEGNPILSAIDRSLNKLGNKPARIMTTEVTRASTMKLINNDRKGGQQESPKPKYDDFMKSIKDFENQRRELLEKMNQIANELDGSQEDSLRELTEKLKNLEEAFRNHKAKQSEELKQLSAKIKALKENQHALNPLLPQKRSENERLEKENQEAKNTLKNVNLAVNNSKQLFSELARKKDELNSFINNVEITLRTTKEKVKTRCEDTVIEEKRSLALEETLHSKKNNFRTFLFLQGERLSLDSSDSNFLYRICAYDNKKRIKLDVNQNTKKQGSIFYEFDSIYYLSPFKEREETVFHSEEQSLYKNLLSSILETEQKMSFIFLVLTHNELSFGLFKNTLQIIVNDYLDISSPQETNLVQFDDEGKVQQEILCSIEDLTGKLLDDDIKANYLLTIQAKLKNYTAIRRLTFILTPGYNMQLIDMLKTAVSFTKNKKNSALSVNQNSSLVSQNIISFLQSIGNSSSLYAMLAMNNEKRADSSLLTSGCKDLESLDILKTLNRLKN